MVYRSLQFVVWGLGMLMGLSVLDEGNLAAKNA